MRCEILIKEKIDKIVLMNPDGKYICQLSDITSSELSIDKPSSRVTNTDKTFSFDFNNPINTDDFYEMLGIDKSKIPYFDTIEIPFVTQTKRHKKKRINKKWIKRYGFKQTYVKAKGFEIHINKDGTFDVKASLNKEK